MTHKTRCLVVHKRLKMMRHTDSHDPIGPCGSRPCRWKSRGKAFLRDWQQSAQRHALFHIRLPEVRIVNKDRLLFLDFLFFFSPFFNQKYINKQKDSETNPRTVSTFRKTTITTIVKKSSYEKRHRTRRQKRMFSVFFSKRTRWPSCCSMRLVTSQRALALCKGTKKLGQNVFHETDKTNRPSRAKDRTDWPSMLIGARQTVATVEHNQGIGRHTKAGGNRTGPSVSLVCMSTVHRLVIYWLRPFPPNWMAASTGKIQTSSRTFGQTGRDGREKKIPSLLSRGPSFDRDNGLARRKGDMQSKVVTDKPLGHPDPDPDPVVVDRPDGDRRGKHVHIGQKSIHRYIISKKRRPRKQTRVGGKREQKARKINK